MKPDVISEPTPSTLVLREVYEERKKQIEKWGNDHDDEHDIEQLIDAANHKLGIDTLVGADWFGEVKDDISRSDLVVAAALIVAEIERRDRRSK